MFTVDEARTAGYQRGKNVSSGQKWAKIGIDTTMEEGETRQEELSKLFTTMIVQAHNSDEAERESPSFQNSIAAKIDGAENAAELWAAFEQGLANGIEDDMRDRFEKAGRRGVQQ
jgi:hypothetical protein